jgi:hypothetical protein
MRLYPGKIVTLVGRSGMSIPVPSQQLLVELEDYPSEDGTVLVGFTLKMTSVLVNVSDLRES